MTKENNKVDNNKHEMDIDTLKKQNVNDLLSIKEIYSKLEELGEKITQVKYIDNSLVKKIKKEYENLNKIIIDENVQVKITNDIETINSKLINKVNKSDIETINSKLDNKVNKSDIETINTHLNTITKNIVVITDYKYLVTEDSDWSNAFITAWNDLNDGGILLIPPQVFTLKKATFRNKKNITIFNGGEIRHMPNLAPQFGVFSFINCENLTINNLFINGTSDSLIDEGVQGGTCLLSIESCKNTTINNLKLIDAQWSALVLNGNCEKTTINNLYCEDIGEHCIYISGVNNNIININDLYAKNCCIHGANTYKAIINTKLSVADGVCHDNLVINRITREQNIATVNMSTLLNTNAIKNVKINDVIIKGTIKNTICIGSINNCVESMIINGGDIDGYLIYNIATKNQKYNCEVHNLKIRGYGLNFINGVNLYENCDFFFETGKNYKTLFLDENYVHDEIKFNNCNFNLATNSLINIYNLDSNYYFLNCNFLNGTSQGVFFEINEVSNDKGITFENANNSINYPVFIRYNKPLFVKFINSKLSCGIRKKSNEVSNLTSYEVINTHFNNSTYNYFNANSYFGADSYKFNGVYNKNTCVDSLSLSSTIKSGSDRVGFDLRNKTCRNLKISDLFISCNKNFEVFEDKSIKNYFWVKLNDTAAEDIQVFISYNIKN